MSEPLGGPQGAPPGGEQPQQPPPPEVPFGEDQILGDPNLAMQVGLTKELGVDPASVFEDNTPKETTGVLEGQELPGTKDAEKNGFDLSEVELSQFTRDMMEMLSMYDSAMYGKREREEEIEAQYQLAVDALHGGTAADAEHLPSEYLMSQVDQASARIEENILGARPLVKIDPIIQTGGPKVSLEMAEDFAKSTENFMNSFVKHDMKLEDKYDIILRRAVKVGTCVLHPQWRRKSERRRYFGNDGYLKTENKTRGGIEVDLPPNRHVIVWPPNKKNWQECSFVGHRFYLTEAEWRNYARVHLRITQAEIDRVLVRGPDDDYAGTDKSYENQGIDADQSLDRIVGNVKLTQLYFYSTLPGRDEPDNGYVIMHEETQQIFLMDENAYWRPRFPYFPVRYKVNDEAAWGDGLGDEILYIQTQDAALRNLQMDNLFAGAFHMVQIAAGSMAQMTIDRPMPGQMVATDKPGEDIVVTQMGGKAEGIDETIEQNRFFGNQASGMAPVLSGQGDPTMKSGAGTGSTLALIEQAGKKFGAIDRQIRRDISPFFEFTLELVTQFAQDGLYYRWASEEDAERLEFLRYEPMRGIIDENLQIYASAPNAATSKEGRQASLMQFWQFMNQHAQLIFEMGEPIYMQINPSGWAAYKEEMIKFLDVMVHEIAHTQEIPGLATMMPALPELTPQSEMMNMMMQKMQEMEQKIQAAEQEKQQQQMMQQMQEMQGGAPGGGAPPEQGMPPQGMPPQGMPPQQMPPGGPMG